MSLDASYILKYTHEKFVKRDEIYLTEKYGGLFEKISPLIYQWDKPKYTLDTNELSFLYSCEVLQKTDDDDEYYIIEPDNDIGIHEMMRQTCEEMVHEAMRINNLRGIDSSKLWAKSEIEKYVDGFIHSLDINQIIKDRMPIIIKQLVTEEITMHDIPNQMLNDYVQKLHRNMDFLMEKIENIKRDYEATRI